MSNDKKKEHVTKTGQQAKPPQDKPEKTNSSQVIGETWADIAPRLDAISWLWQNWIPRGFITILAGAPGVGKSVLALDLIRSAVTGECWPDGQPGSGKNGVAIWCEAEGSLALNVDRAKQFGVPLDAIVSPLPRDENHQSFQIDKKEHLRFLEDRIKARTPELIVIDALTGSHSAKEDNSTMTRILQPIARFAEKYNLAVVIIHHLRKRDAMDISTSISLDELRGSGAIAAVARSVIGLDKPGGSRSKECRLSAIKNNLALPCEPLGFVWEEEENGGFRLNFTQAEKETQPSTLQEKAIAHLQEILVDGSKPVQEVKSLLGTESLKEETVRKAASRMNLNRTSIDGVNHWSLPGRVQGS